MFLADIPEKQPALLSLVYVGGFALLALLLFLSLLLARRRRRSALDAVAPADLPPEVRERLGTTSANHGLRALRWLFLLLALAVFGFHVYWAEYAAETNDRFQELSYKDLRNRRLAESTLRGWILDRTGQLDRALALYRRAPDGQIVRDYPLDTEVAQLLGSDRGDPGLERALFGIQSEAAPEALDVVEGKDIKQPANLDVRLTIDSELQKEAVAQLHDRHGAVVVLNPQTGEVLAMYSNPSYSLKAAQDEEAWIKLEANKRDNPLVNRALGAYYVPGSTFKTVVMTAAFLNGMQDAIFSGYPGGYIAEPGAKPITDDNGSCEVCGPMHMDQALMISSNQYFAQMAVKLGPERLAAAAKLFGIGTYDDATDLLRGRKRPDIWDASSDAVRRALAPRESTILASPKMRTYDLALEGFGQGYAGQQTPLQMAMIVSAIGNLQGQLMKPKIEFDLAPAVFSQVMPPQIAAEERRIMGLVTMGPSGTATSVFGPITAQGITSGGKTGTAQKEVPEYDPKTGEMKMEKKFERDRRGNVIREYEVPIISPEKRIDSWFLCMAPLDRPQLAIAVIVEGGGYGARAAAPIASALVLKARDLGLLTVAGQSPQQNQPQPSRGQQPRQHATPQPNATPAAQARNRAANQSNR
ncbi:MAG TPA: penicillin-binding transpeptidase domain-containing protein [Pyrinomonadaceae bacterium]|nr:penicillin-binding transpeptidase domain-containing protein [Pyrinomonadaceae bacterium]